MSSNQSNSVDIYTLESLLRSYAVLTNIKVEQDMHNVTVNYMNHAFPGRTRSIKMDLNFYSKESLLQFTEDLNRLEELKEDTRIIRNNPTVKRAYEEYQLLLKLSK